MQISFCCKDANAGIWLQELQAALPQATVTPWQPGAVPADFAVVWAPPQQFFDEQPQLRAIFNVGAGVDALMKLRLPAQSLVVRLDDAGMAVQMAEYVCHAVTRHVRELDAYEAQAAEGRWQHRTRRDRSAYPVGVMGLGVLGERVARPAAVRISGARLEPHAQGPGRRGVPRRHGGAACLFGPLPRAGVPAAAHARHPGHPEPRHPGPVAAGWLPDQRGARRPSGGRRPAGAAG